MVRYFAPNLINCCIKKVKSSDFRQKRISINITQLRAKELMKNGKKRKQKNNWRKSEDYMILMTKMITTMCLLKKHLKRKKLRDQIKNNKEMRIVKIQREKRKKMTKKIKKITKKREHRTLTETSMKQKKIKNLFFKRSRKPQKKMRIDQVN